MVIKDTLMQEMEPRGRKKTDQKKWLIHGITRKAVNPVPYKKPPVVNDFQEAMNEPWFR